MTKEQATREALELALETLEECRRDPRLKYEHPTYDKTITAIKEALQSNERPQNCGTSYCSCIECVMEKSNEQVEEKPVAFICQGNVYMVDHIDEYCTAKHIPLYTKEQL